MDCNKKSTDQSIEERLTAHLDYHNRSFYAVSDLHGWVGGFFRRREMLMRIFVGLIILIAIVVGLCALLFNRDQIINLIYFRDFFDVSLPILGFGALIKYLCSCCLGCKDCSKK